MFDIYYCYFDVNVFKKIEVETKRNMNILLKLKINQKSFYQSTNA